MKNLVRILGLVYQYVTGFIVIASPLFFIPTTVFSPDVSYYLAMITATAIALTAYILNALLTRTWHSISRFEFIGYTAFSLAVILSAVLSRDPNVTFFGDGINAFVAASLLVLPAVMYLVRTLPDGFRDFLKRILVVILSVSALLFIVAFIVKGALGTTLAKVFLGFTSTLSLAAYIGIFVLAILVYVRRSSHHIKYKIPLLTGALVFVVVLVTIGYQGDIRPNIQSSFQVASNVLVKDGIFGIGAGDYARAWQLYRPTSVMTSQFFSVDFNQASGTLTTFLSTIGVVGTLAFLFLVLGSLFFTFRLYLRATETREHRILGLLTLTLLYFVIVSVLVPFTYAMLVLWMVVAGFGIARMPVGSNHPSKKIALVFVPIAIILCVHAVTTINKTRAFLVYASAQTELNQKGATDQAEKLLNQSAAIYKYDGFYRTMVEYAIARERILVSTATGTPDELKTQYLARAKYAVDSGLEAVKLSPSNYQNYVSLGRAYELAMPFDKENAYANAKKSYQKAIDLYPQNPFLYVIQARLEASAGSREGVRTQLTEALKKKQNFADALFLMSQLEASEQKIDEALNYAIEAVKAAPNDPSTYVQAGLLFYGKRDYQNAVVALQRALQLDQNNQNTAYFLALALRDGGRPDLAKLIGSELLNRNPGNADLETFLKSLEPQATSTPATKTSTTKKK
jgi:tetratricopeptide (TPR) repeat protein